MRVPRSLLSDARRLFSSANARTPKTAVLFLHFGQPKNAYYAKDLLHKISVDFYGVPKRLSGIVPASFLVNKKIHACVDVYGSQTPVEDTISSLADEVESSLAQLVPEFSPIKCHVSFPYETEALKQEIEAISRSGVDRLLLFPLYSHFSCAQHGLLLNAASKIVYETTLPLKKDETSSESSRIVPKTEFSYDISAIHRWSSHPTISDLWSQRLNEVRDSFDAVVFCAPAMRGFGRQEFARSVWTSCERTMEKVECSVPWRLGFYNSWMEAGLPLRDSLNKQIRRLAREKPHQRRVAVVPVTELFPTFDTLSVVPSLIAKEESAVFLDPPSSSDVLSQGIAEVLKNHLLGRRNAQLQQFCDGCIRKECEITRLLLA